MSIGFLLLKSVSMCSRWCLLLQIKTWFFSMDLIRLLQHCGVCISFDQLRIKRSRGWMNQALGDSQRLRAYEFQRGWIWDLEGPMAMFWPRFWWVSTNFANWVLMMLLVQLVLRIEDDWQKFYRTGQKAQSCRIWPVKLVPWSPWSSRGVPQVGITSFPPWG